MLKTHKQAYQPSVSLDIIQLYPPPPRPCPWIPKWKANQLTTHQFLIILVSSLLTALSFPVQLDAHW